MKFPAASASPTIPNVVAFIAAHRVETLLEMPSNVGDLIGTGRSDLASHNTENLLSLVDRFGFVANGNRTLYLGVATPVQAAARDARLDRRRICGLANDFTTS